MTTGFAPAPLFSRLSAVMLDVILQFIVIYLVIPIVIGMILPEAIRGQVILGAFLMTIIVYEPLFVSMRGQTIGHLVFKVRVEDKNGGSVHFFQAMTRMFLKWILGTASLITMAFGRNQAIHDHLTSSQAVRAQ